MSPQKEQINQLVQQITDLYEVDIGDFKRKILSYLNSFIVHWETSYNTLPFETELQQVRQSIMCNNTTDIEQLREQVLTQIQQFYQSVSHL